MIKIDNEWMTKLTEGMGSIMGGVYTAWHDMYSTELSYRWLEENNYPIENVLEQKYLDELTLYLLRKFVDWYKDQLKED